MNATQPAPINTKEARIRTLIRKARARAATAFGQIRRMKLECAFDIGHYVYDALKLAAKSNDPTIFTAFAGAIGYGMQPHHMRYCLRLYTLLSGVQGNHIFAKLVERGVGFSPLYPALEDDVPDGNAYGALKAVADREIGPKDLVRRLAPVALSARKRRSSVTLAIECPRRPHSRLHYVAEMTGLTQRQVMQILVLDTLRLPADTLVGRVINHKS